MRVNRAVEGDIVAIELTTELTASDKQSQRDAKEEAEDAAPQLVVADSTREASVEAVEAVLNFNPELSQLNQDFYPRQCWPPQAPRKSMAV